MSLPTQSDHYLLVTDTVTGTSIRVPINTRHNTVASSAFAALKVPQTMPLPLTPQTTPVRIYDNGFKNTVVCTSKVSQLMAATDGANARLTYRGYGVEELVEKSTFLEVAFLLIHGELPSKEESHKWTDAVLEHTYVHAELEKQMTTFRHDAHPMGMLIATVASLSTFHPDANPALQGDAMYMKPKAVTTSADERLLAKTVANRNRAITRILGKVPTIAGFAYRNRMGRTYNSPMPNCSNYAENFLYMIDKLNEPNYIPDPRIVKVLDKMFILLAEHGSNCSTITMRHLTSSGVDPYTALSGAYGALFGERKASAVIDMLNLIGTPENVQPFLDLVKAKACVVKGDKGGLAAKKSDSGVPVAATRLQGFGHRIYKSTDPRCEIAKKLAFELFDLIGKGSLGSLALHLEETALSDSYFTSRNLYPNIDFWTAVVFHVLGFPSDMFPVLTAIPRTAGLIAHCQESLDDPEYKIYRPRQVYTGEFLREYVHDRAEIDVEGVEDAFVEGEGAGGYVKSLPAQANKRLSLSQAPAPLTDGIEAQKLLEFQGMIERTRASIKELARMSENNPATKKKYSAWVIRKSQDGIEAQSERLSKTQNELQDLLKKQEELLDLYMTHRSTKEAAAATSEATSPALAKVPLPEGGNASPPAGRPMERSASVNKLAAHPDLLAGSHSPRPIMKKPHDA
ncbi:hypothetical protein HDU81_007795 [Chytriomyces hyalinus]|nr:hypothetical protein HDU81_007795 [Chytriomyces hyalinus]